MSPGRPLPRLRSLAPRAAWPAAAFLVLLAGAPAPVAGQELDLDPELGPRLEELERRFLQRVGEALELGEAERRRLGEALAATRVDRRRNLERRRALRAELEEAVTAAEPDQTRVARLLDEWSEVQLREAEIFRDEQRRLAAFLTPVQRARFLYLRQRFVRAAAERLREGRGGAALEGTDRRRPGGARDAPRP